MSAGFSSYRDEGTNHPDADGSCWWCWRPVLGSLHNFTACHQDFLPKRRERKPKPEPPDPIDDKQESLPL